MVKRWQRKLTDRGVWLLENELHHLYDINLQPPHEIKRQAVEYVRRRLSEMVGYKLPFGYEAACWFFQESLPDTRGHVLALREGGRVVLERLQGARDYNKRWSW